MTGAYQPTALHLVLAKRLIEGGNLDAALNAIETHETRHAGDPHAFALRAEIAYLRHDYDTALAQFDAARDATGDATDGAAEIIAGAGAAAFALGRIARAEAAVAAAIGQGARTPRAWLTLALALFALGRDEDLLTLADQGRATADLDAMTVRAVCVIAAIRAYTRNRLEQSRRQLTFDASHDAAGQSHVLGLETYQRLIEANIGGRIVPDRKLLLGTLGYHDYLEKLIAFRSNHPTLYGDGDAPPVHLIGDSHVLSPAHTVVTFAGARHRVVAHPVIGAKAWHLAPGANPVRTPQQEAFERIGAALPHGEPAILCFGEIDCRVNEGLLPFLAAHPDRDPERHCRALADAYAAYAVQILAKRKRTIALCGVPAPHPIQANKAGTNTRRFVDLVRLFNTCLADAARERGLAFLDPHRLTDADDGVASGDRHLDTIHLSPDAFHAVVASAGTPYLTKL